MNGKFWRKKIRRGLCIISLATLILTGAKADLSHKTENPKKYFLNYPDRLEARIKKEGSQPNNLPDRIGAIILGSEEYNFHIEIGRCYQTLLENNWDPKNIYILSRSGKRNFCHPVDDVATKESFLMLLNHLSKKVDNKDLFLLYMNGHGTESEYQINGKGEDIGISGFSFEGKTPETINSFNSVELKNYLSYIKSKYKIVIIGSCNSGGFSESMKKDNFFGKDNLCTIITSSSISELASYNDNYSFDGFLFEGLSVINKKERDKNKDGRISLKEAFDYTLKQLNDLTLRKEARLSAEDKQTPDYYSAKSLDSIFIDENWNK